MPDLPAKCIRCVRSAHPKIASSEHVPIKMKSESEVLRVNVLRCFSAVSRVFACELTL